MSTSGVKLDPTLVSGALTEAAPGIVDQYLGGIQDDVAQLGDQTTDLAGQALALRQLTDATFTGNVDTHNAQQINTKGTAVRTAVDAAASTLTKPMLSKLRANTMVVVGDSLTNNGGGPGVQSAPGVISVNATRSFRPGAAWTWANVLLGHRLKVLRNAGIGGETTTQILARYATDVLPYAAAVVVILAGTNDSGIDATAAVVSLSDSKNNLMSMIDQSQAQGSLVVVGTIPPRGYGGSGVRGAAARAHALALNEFIRRLPYIRPGVVAVDFYAVTADPANEDQWLPGYALSEGGNYTHWAGPGAYAAGRALADAITPFVPAVPQVTRVTNDPTNVVGGTRNLFLGAAAGVAPAGWTLDHPEYVTGLVPRTDGLPGWWLEIVVPAGGTVTASRDITGSVAVGDNVRASLEFECSGLETIAFPNAANQRMSWGLLVAPDYIATDDLSAVAGSDANHGNQARRGVLQPPDYVRQAGDTSIALGLRIAGGGTYHVACATAIKPPVS